MKTDYTREDLIRICEKSFITKFGFEKGAELDFKRQVGDLYAILKSWPNFKIITDGNLATDDKTIWIEIDFQDCQVEKETFYLCLK